MFVFRPISCTSASGDAGTGEKRVCDVVGSLKGISLILLKPFLSSSQRLQALCTTLLSQSHIYVIIVG